MDERASNETLWRIVKAVGGFGGIVAVCALTVAILTLAQQMKSDNDQGRAQATEIAHAEQQSYMLGTIAAAPQATYEIPPITDTPSPTTAAATATPLAADNSEPTRMQSPTSTPAGNPTVQVVAPTQEPVVAATLAPTPRTDVISIWGVEETGAKININRSCVYNIAYLGDAYSPWPYEGYTGYQGWTTIARIYVNRPVEWGITSYGLVGPVNHDHYLGPGGYHMDKEDAINASVGDSRTLRLTEGDFVTIVLLDEQGRYDDNRGKVDIGVTCLDPF